ncbi:hypothetical protein [Streptomyces scabiei]|uniref:hypothetical protein n=1 Tax=Streptomyces scabiei TaxID=1930 RepID=UPI00073F6952|nr:hypothetical protein [Streptomyces scabiei]
MTAWPLGRSNTLRSCGIGADRTAGHLGDVRTLATVADDGRGGALERLWGEAAVTTWNARRAALLSWPGTTAPLPRPGEADASAGLAGPLPAR